MKKTAGPINGPDIMTLTDLSSHNLSRLISIQKQLPQHIRTAIIALLKSV